MPGNATELRVIWVQWSEIILAQMNYRNVVLGEKSKLLNVIAKKHKFSTEEFKKNLITFFDTEMSNIQDQNSQNSVYHIKDKEVRDEEIKSLKEALCKSTVGLSSQSVTFRSCCQSMMTLLKTCWTIMM